MTSMDRRALLAAAAALPFAAGPAAAALKTTPPQSLGFSADGLKALDVAMHGLVDEAKLAGVATLVARHGKIAHLDAYGVTDLETKAPVKLDTIWRIASMTKPVAGVAMMILWEEGKWALDDPVAKHVPQFAGLQVAKAGGGTEPQAQPMTMRQLMSHSAGFDRSQALAYKDLVDWEKPLSVMIDKLATLPLAFQPGTQWRYGPSVDVQGYIVERLSGQGFDEFLEARVFKPLRMKDTGFWVAKEKLPRVSKIFTYGPDRKIRPWPETWDPYPKPAYLSGSGGLMSTLEDYWRFCQMLLNGGQLEGARILKASTVALMRTNVLADNVPVNLFGPPQPGIRFGLDFAIIADPAAAGSAAGAGSYFWSGAWGTWFWIDPVNDLIVIGMIQNLNGVIPGFGTPDVRKISGQAIYAALKK